MFEHLIVSLALLWSAHATPAGNHTCTGVVKHEVTVRVNVTEPVTFRAYEWCLRVPPRCSTYTIQLKDRVKIHKEMHNRTITVCCKGYVEIDYKCVPACPPETECPNMHCNRTNHCYCTPGYTGLYCNAPCPKGVWGAGCIKECDCPTGYTCHHLTGDCMLDDSPPTKTRRTTSSEFLTEVPTTIQTTVATTRIQTTREFPSTTEITTQQSTRKTSTPTTQAPTTAASTTQAPTTAASTTQAPKTTTSTTQAPETTTSTTQAPKTTTPTTRAAETITSTTQAPKTTTSTTQAPETTTSTTAASETTTSTTQAPPTTSSTTQAPKTTTERLKTTEAATTEIQDVAPPVVSTTQLLPVIETRAPSTTEVSTSQPTTTTDIPQIISAVHMPQETTWRPPAFIDLIHHIPTPRMATEQTVRKTTTFMDTRNYDDVPKSTATKPHEEKIHLPTELATEQTVRKRPTFAVTRNYDDIPKSTATKSHEEKIHLSTELATEQAVRETTTFVDMRNYDDVPKSTGIQSHEEKVHTPMELATEQAVRKTPTFVDTRNYDEVPKSTGTKPHERKIHFPTELATEQAERKTTTFVDTRNYDDVPKPSGTKPYEDKIHLPTELATEQTVRKTTTLVDTRNYDEVPKSTRTKTLEEKIHLPTELATEQTVGKTPTFVDRRNYDDVPKLTGRKSNEEKIPVENTEQEARSSTPNFEPPAVFGNAIKNINNAEVDVQSTGAPAGPVRGANIEKEVKRPTLDGTSTTDVLDRLIVEDVRKPLQQPKPTTDESPIKLVEEVISKYFPDTLLNPLPGGNTPKEKVRADDFGPSSVELKKITQEEATTKELPSTIEVTIASVTEGTTTPIIITTTMAPSSAPTTQDISTIPIITPKVIVSAKNPDEIDLGGVIYRKMKFLPPIKSAEDITTAPKTAVTPPTKQPLMKQQEQPTTPEGDRFKIYLPEYEREAEKEKAGTEPPVKTFLPKFNYDKEEYDFGKQSQPKKSKQKDKETKKYKVKPQEVTASPYEDGSNERVTNNVFLETKEFKVHLASTKAQKYGESYYTKSALDQDSSVHDWSKFNKKKGKYGEQEPTKQVKFTPNPAGYGLDDAGITTKGLTEIMYPTTNAKPPHTWYSHAREKAKIKNALKALKSTITYDNVKPTEDSMIEESNDIHSLPTQYTEREPRAAVAAAVTYQEDPNNPQMFGQVKFNAPEGFSSSLAEERGSSGWVASMAVGGGCFLAMATLMAVLWLRLRRHRRVEVSEDEDYNERRFAVKETSSSHLNAYETVYPVTNESDRLEVETFFCPTFTNNYAERINRELNELSYDHPRSSFVEPLYAEILHPKIKEVE